MVYPVYFLKINDTTPSRGYWDMSLLEDMLQRKVWEPVSDIYFGLKDIDIHDKPNDDFAIVVIPAKYAGDSINAINKLLARLRSCIVMLVSDEDNNFPIDKLKHPRMVVYIQYPHEQALPFAHRVLPVGYPSGTPSMLKEHDYNNKKGWFFSGQVTNQSRKEMLSVLKDLDNGLFFQSDRFAGGLKRTDYLEKTTRARVIPCPDGAIVPESFRLYEALEAHCMPIVCGRPSYWEYIFGGAPPFPILPEWNGLPDTIRFHIDVYPNTTNRVIAWYLKKKRHWVYDLHEDIAYLTGKKMQSEENITVLIPTSPIKSHPDTSILETTVRSIRERLPESEIIIMFDGVREEQADRTASYQEYIRRVLVLCSKEWHNVLPLVFDKHTHQVGMAREALKLVKTPVIMYVEHDAPLCEYIPFEKIVTMILEKQAKMVRLHHEAIILDDHKHMMLDKKPIEIDGELFMRTAQWSQRPHLASTDFYRSMLESCFTPGAKSMIEDGVHGKLWEAYRNRGLAGWYEWKVWMYTPPGDMKRSLHLDARGADSKFEDTFKY